MQFFRNFLFCRALVQHFDQLDVRLDGQRVNGPIFVRDFDNFALCRQHLLDFIKPLRKIHPAALGRMEWPRRQHGLIVHAFREPVCRLLCVRQRIFRLVKAALQAAGFHSGFQLLQRP